MVARSQEGEHRLDKPPHETAISRIGGIVAVKPLLRLFCGRVGKVGPSHKRGLATRAPKIGFAIEHRERSWRRASTHAAGGVGRARANSRIGRASGQERIRKEERRVGKGWGGKGRCRGWPEHL